MKMEKTFLSAAVLTACVGFAGSASAALTVNFEQQSVFAFDFNDPSTTPTPVGAAIGVHGSFSDRVTGVESIWWPATDGGATRGTASVDSPIDTTDLNAPSAPTVVANGVVQDPVSALKVVGNGLGVLEVPEDGSLSEWATLATLFHRNNSISPGNSLTGGSVASSTLFSFGGESVADANAVDFSFNETSNDGNCSPEGNPNGTDCDDLFLFPFLSFADVPITIGGVDFLFSFDIAAASGVETDLADCNLGNCTTPGFVTIWTGEGSVNSIRTLVAARLAPPEEVPAPGTLSILGLGLAGLGAMLRRRRITAR